MSDLTHLPLSNTDVLIFELSDERFDHVRVYYELTEPGWYGALNPVLNSFGPYKTKEEAIEDIDAYLNEK